MIYDFNVTNTKLWCSARTDFIFPITSVHAQMDVYGCGNSSVDTDWLNFPPGFV